MKIGMFTDSYFPQISGVSTSISILREQLIKAGHEVVIFTTTDPKAQVESGIVRLPSVPFASFEDRRVAVAGFDRCLKIARDYELDIVHTHTEFTVGLTGKYVASRMKIPSVHTYHTMYENYTHYIWNGHLIQPSHVRWYSRIFCSQTDGVITPSQLTYNTLQKYGVNVPMKIIPTGVVIPEYNEDYRKQLRTQLHLKDEDIVLLSLSRLSKEKSIDEVIDSFAKIKQKVNNAHLIIAGDGPQRKTLETLAKGLNLTDVQFLGEVPHEEVNAYYQMADLYINASESESQGLTYLEAIANKLPIISKENVYLKTIVRNDAFGKLYGRQDSLAETVINYLESKEAGEIIEIDQQLLEEISAESFARKVAGFYTDILQTSNYTGTKFYERIVSAAKDLF